MSDYNRTTVLYFLQDGMKTDEDSKAIATISGQFEKTKVMLRNGAVDENGSLEKCDYVAGPQIPTRYARAFPTINADGSTNGGDAPFQPNAEGFTAVSEKGEASQSLAAEIGSVSDGWGAPIR